MILFKREIVAPWFIRTKSDSPSVWGGDAGLQIKIFNAGSGGSYTTQGRTVQILLNDKFVWEATFVWCWDVTRKRWKETNAEGRALSELHQRIRRGCEEYDSWYWLSHLDTRSHLTGFDRSCADWGLELERVRKSVRDNFHYDVETLAQ